MFDDCTCIDLVEKYVFSDNSGLLFRNHVKSYTKFSFRATNKGSWSQPALVKETSTLGYLERILCKALSEVLLELIILLLLWIMILSLH